MFVHGRDVGQPYRACDRCGAGWRADVLGWRVAHLLGGSTVVSMTIHDGPCPWAVAGVLDDRHGHLHTRDGSVGVVVLRGDQLEDYVAGR